MGLLPIDLLKPNMVLAENIEKKNIIYVKRGTVITHEVIGILYRLNVKACDVETCTLPDTQIKDDYIGYQDMDRLYKTFTDIINNYDSISIKNATSQVRNKVEELVDLVLFSERKEIYDLRHRIIESREYAHGISTTILSIMFGNALELSKDELISIGLSSLFSDFGMYMMPASVWQKPSRLSSEDWSIVKRHPRESVNFIRENLNLPFSVNQAILDHHERFDGQGYPEGRKGSKISKYARIIMIADVYDAMTRTNHYRDRISRADALEYIIGGSDILFDGSLVKTFEKSLIMYPIDASVKLSNGAIGKVLTNVINNKRPVVAIYYMDGQLLSECAAINLNDIHNLNITITDCYGM